MNKENTPQNYEQNAAGNANPWQKLAEEVPPFSAKTDAEPTKPKTFINDEGLELIQTYDMPVSTEEQKLAYLGATLDNATQRLQKQIENAIEDDDNNEAEFQKDELKKIERQQTILLERVNPDEPGGVLGSLRRQRNQLGERIHNHPEMSDSAKESAFNDLFAYNNLIGTLELQLADNNPDYFSKDNLSKKLMQDAEQAEKAIKKSMTDSYFDENGQLRKLPEGQQQRTPETDIAEANLAQANQDIKTFQLIMQDFENPTDTAYAYEKTAVQPAIESFIQQRTTQIDQLSAAARNLPHDSPAFTANLAQRRALAKERSSAKRIAAKYFKPITETPKTSTTTTTESPKHFEQQQEQQYGQSNEISM